MTSRRKGNDNEAEAKNIWAAVHGEQFVERATGGGYQSPDFFDLYDLMVWTPEGFDLIQVKTNGAAGINGYVEATEPHHGREDLNVLMAVRYDREGWRLIGVDEGDYETIYDEREDTDVGSNRHTELNLGEGLERFLAFRRDHEGLERFLAFRGET